MKSLIVPLERLGDFDEIVDVRTPLEYADDHVPGAINAPVLSNEERVTVGTMYAQVSPFEATRLGATLVARNIATHLETLFADRPRQWRPLIYCWRGGKRSGSMTAWFNMIGWQARQLDGGYKAYRRSVLGKLETLPAQFRYMVLTGHTGTGKTRLLDALAAEGAQALDLERLALHRGSLLGALPRQPQPSQKRFETDLAAALDGFDRARPVFVEAESSRIGRISVPTALLACVHRGDCIEVQASLADRVAFLLQDYAHLFDEPENFKQTLARYTLLHGKKIVQHWHDMIDADARAQLFTELIELHYDPAYARSSGAHFQGLDRALRCTLTGDPDDCRARARDLLRRLDAAAPHTPGITAPTP